AQRPGVPLRQRLARRLPSLRRVLAGLGAVAATAGLVALLQAPWLRVSEVGWAGEHYTDPDALSRILAAQRGASVLTVNTGALASQIERLPAVAEARVHATLPDRIEATVVEREPAFVWQTSRARLLGAADGTLFAALPADAALPTELATLPIIDDRRAMARLIAAGDVVPAGLAETAMELASIQPEALGSAAARLSVRLDDQHGFVLVSGRPEWRAALGFYGHDPAAAPQDAGGRIHRQVAAIRTLFASEPEESVGWVDARNPGKVYFRARG
ncbi:MAG: cell division protein FtsQ/DivIB, partial [Candidatus Limnocylindria bacterium]